jgi:4-amino-4-deoxy-L-arabinose transferase-like glycosyltransferase
MLNSKFLTFLCKKHTGNILAILIIAIFFILSLIRLYPFNNQLNNVLSDTGDDWCSYTLLALDIKHNGLLMPSIEKEYDDPASFLYNYFIALCFLLFGENTVPIFIIQNLMLGLSVALVYWTFRDKMRNFTGLIFLGILSVFALLDVYKYYSFRLLSENLAFFIISLFFFCFIRGFERDKFNLQIISAFLMGILILTRANMVLFGIVLIFIVTPFYLKKGKVGTTRLLLFISTLALSSSFLAIRNYLVCGSWRWLPQQVSPLNFIRRSFSIPNTVNLSKINNNFFYTKLHINSHVVEYIEYLIQKPSSFFGYFLKKTLFCFGFLPILNSSFRLRPHWLLMWAAYFTYLFLHFKNYGKFKMWESTVHLYILCYYGLLILASKIQIQNYGFRMLIPATNFVLVFSFLAFDTLKEKRCLRG